MEMDTYNKAVHYRSKIHRLEIIKSELENGNIIPILGHDKENNGQTFELDADVMEKIYSSVLAIINIELRELKNKFLEL